MKGSTSAISSKSKSASSKCKLPPSSAMITQLRVPSNLSYFRDLINKRTVLDQRHMNLLENTPFHNFLRIPASLSNEQIALDCLIQKFNAANCSFMIGNKECVFGIDDIYRITGLPKEGTLIKMSGAAPNTTYTQIIKNYKTSNEKKGSRGKGKKKVVEEKKAVIWGKRDRMADLIVDMADKDPTTCVKLIVAFIIGFILCPRTCRTCPLWAFRYAEQLSTLNNFNWCHAVHTFLCKEMSKAKKAISMRGLGERSYAGYMGGFSSVLLVWFYERLGECGFGSVFLAQLDDGWIAAVSDRGEEELGGVDNEGGGEEGQRRATTAEGGEGGRGGHGGEGQRRICWGLRKILGGNRIVRGEGEMRVLRII